MTKDGLPRDYRFKSDLAEFKAAVEYTEELLSRNELLLVYGFRKNITVKAEISKERFEERYDSLSWDKYYKILRSEILVILEQNYCEPVEEERGLVRYLRDEKVDEEKIAEISSVKIEKRRYVLEKLNTEEGRARYQLKKNTISHLLSDIRYDVCRTTGEEISTVYANIRIQTNDILADEGLPRQIANLVNANNSREISFICDKEDIEYLISELRDIQKKM